MKSSQAPFYSLLCTALALSLSLSACNAPAATGTAPLPTGISHDIAPLPKGPRQPVASPDAGLALPRLDFEPLFPAADSGFGPGSKGPSTPVAALPTPGATSDISVVEQSSFNGRVFDTEQDPVSGAVVTARSLNSSVPYEATTLTLKGAYAFNNVPAGVLIVITVKAPGKPAQQRVEVIKSNKAGDPAANRYDFGSDGSGYGSAKTAIGNPPAIAPIPTPSPYSNYQPSPDPSPLPTLAPSPEPQATSQPEQLLNPPPSSAARTGPDLAGSWRDLDHWNDWLRLVSGRSQAELLALEQAEAQAAAQPSGTPNPQPTATPPSGHRGSWGSMLSVWGISPVYRLGVQLRRGEAPVVDQPLLLKDADGRQIGQARSDARGQAVFFAGLFATAPGPFSIETPDGQAALGNLYPAAEDRVMLLPEKPEAALPDTVDLMWLVDTTDSMGEELARLKADLPALLTRASQAETGLKWRAGAAFYRDQGDAYLVRDFALSEDLSQFERQLRAQTADGGGDAPEALAPALDKALSQNWSASARARLLFLVLDTTPHHTPAVLAQLRQQIERARQLGVRIIPVASNGVDKDTEFLMRLLAISTGGEYVFMTEQRGIGEPLPTIGAYDTEPLDALLLKLIQKYSG